MDGGAAAHRRLESAPDSQIEICPTALIASQFMYPLHYSASVPIRQRESLQVGK
jgi:hypothetical protein